MTTLALTPGCPAGIGPEVIARAVVDVTLPAGAKLMWMASTALLLEGARRAQVASKQVGDDGVMMGRGARARFVRTMGMFVEAKLKPGAPSSEGDEMQRDALVRACELAARGEVDGIVTGPVRKQALVVDGVHYAGQTEIVHHFLAGDAEAPLMVFAGGPFVMGLQTVHVALHDVRAHLTSHALDVALDRLHDATAAIAKKRTPRLVVLGVNPHAGEGGMFGREEIDVVTPALERAKARGLDVRGPVPADGFFADVARGAHKGKSAPDGVLAMHHDQGLAPYKLLVGGEGINVTWGLRAPRTSPDHGTAYTLAGKSKASAASMKAAIELCARLAKSSSARRAP